MRGRRGLEDAYRQARYGVLLGRHCVDLAIGRADARADAALRRAGCRAHWCLLTPCNPGSRLLSPSDNARRLHQMRQLVRRRGWRALPAVNRAADGRWREPGLCLLDVPPSAVRQLAHRYGQCAWVFGRIGAAPHLVWTTRAPRQ